VNFKQRSICLFCIFYIISHSLLAQRKFIKTFWGSLDAGLGSTTSSLKDRLAGGYAWGFTLRSQLNTTLLLGIGGQRLYQNIGADVETYNVFFGGIWHHYRVSFTFSSGVSFAFVKEYVPPTGCTSVICPGGVHVDKPLTFGVPALVEAIWGSKNLGIGIKAYANINREDSFYYIGLMLAFGKIRPRY